MSVAAGVRSEPSDVGGFIVDDSRSEYSTFPVPAAVGRMVVMPAAAQHGVQQRGCQRDS